MSDIKASIFAFTFRTALSAWPSGCGRPTLVIRMLTPKESHSIFVKLLQNSLHNHGQCILLGTSICSIFVDRWIWPRSSCFCLEWLIQQIAYALYPRTFCRFIIPQTFQPYIYANIFADFSLSSFLKLFLRRRKGLSVSWFARYEVRGKLNPRGRMGQVGGS